MNVISAQNWSLIAFVIGVIFLCVFMLTVPVLLGGRSQGRDKHKPFESGIVGVGGARMRFSAKFYLVAIFFVIFDVEALFLYAWAVSVRESGWMGFIEVSIFIAILLVGLIYILRIGGLSWSPADLNKNKRSSQNKHQNNAHVGLNLADVTNFIPMEILELDPRGKVPAQLSGKINTGRSDSGLDVSTSATETTHLKSDRV